MMLSGIGLFKGMMAKMSWLDQNQRVIAQNVANADTPGYRGKTLEKPDFGSLMTASQGPKLKMAATESDHLGGAAAGASGKSSGQNNQKVKYEVSPDDNGIVLEEQLFKANQNATDYQLVTNLYRRNAGMLRMVVQGR